MTESSEYALQAKAELLFPAHLISSLRDLRGEEWRALVDRVATLPINRQSSWFEVDRSKPILLPFEKVLGLQ